MRVSINDRDEHMPIKTLNMYSSDWRIKARVTKLGDIRTWNNARGSGKLLNIDLMDREGTQIQATFFNDAADKFVQELEQNKVYTFAGGMVKMANKKFTAIPNDFCLTFDARAEIAPAGEDRAIQARGYSFTKLSKVGDMVQQQTVDVVGVILSMFSVQSIQLKDGGTRNKRTMTVADDSLHAIDITVWGELAESVDFQVGAVYAFCNCRVSEFSGRSLNASPDRGDLVPDVKHPEAVKVVKWFASGSLDDHLQRVARLSGGGGGSGAADVRCSIAQMVEMAESDETLMDGMKAAWYRVEAFSSWFPGVIDGQRPAYYMGCKVCKKKVTEESNGYSCQACNKVYDEAVPSWNFSAKICDYSDSIFLQFLGD